MPEITNESTLETERFLANSEQVQRDQTDEEALQDLAEFIMVTADSVGNPNLAVKLRDLANEIVRNKAVLASTPGANEQAVSPEEALAQQGMQAGMPPGMPPMPPGMAQGMPPGAF